VSMSDGWKNNGTLPWTHGCLVCGESNERGLQLRSRIEDGKVCLDYTTRQTDLGWRSAVHGGLTMTLLDEVMTWAAMIDASMACVTAEMTTRNKLPVHVGQELRVEGWVTQNRRKIVLTEGRMIDSEGNVLATATGKYMQMPGEQYRICEDDFVAGEGAIPVGKLIQG
jgi:acyl-coenzyme A thioesterase PaaI-like protein